MVGAKSHFTRVGRSALPTVAVIMPVAVALAGSFFLGREAFKVQDDQTQQMKQEEVRAQSRLLLDHVWNALDGVKLRATYWTPQEHTVKSTSANRGSDEMDTQILTSSIIEMDAKGNPHNIRNFTTNPIWTAQQAPKQSSQFLKDLELKTTQAALTVSMQEIRDTGYSVVRIGRIGQLLGVAFYAPLKSGIGRSSLKFVTVDPVQVFSSFSRWVSRREGGVLRGYLIAADGKVLVHSEKVYSGSDFSGAQVYQKALLSLFRNERASGVATYTGVDFRNVLTSYVRVTSLPFAVVVERVVRPMGSTLFRQILIPAMLLASFVLILCLFSIIAIRKIMSTTDSRTVVQIPEGELTYFKHQLQAAVAWFPQTVMKPGTNIDTKVDPTVGEPAFSDPTSGAITSPDRGPNSGHSSEN